MEYRDFKLTPHAFQEAVMENAKSKAVLDVLDALIDKEGRSITTKSIDFIKDYISGKNTFDRFVNILSAHDSSTLCGSLWDSNSIAYRCRTCSTFTYMSLCSTCFENGNHEGHDFNMFKSFLGGACDCGCIDVMKPSGFCPSHGPNRVCLNPPPEEIICCAKVILPRFLKVVLHMFRLNVSNYEFQQAGLFELLFELCFGFLKDMCELGSVIRQIISDTLLDPQEYDDPILSQSSIAKTFQAFVRDQMNVFIHPLFSSYLSQEFSGYKTMLEEYVFCCVQAGLPSLVLEFLLNLLPVDEFKTAFFVYFINHYLLTLKVLFKSKDASLINRLAHVTIQLFSSSTLVHKGIIECNLIPIMLNSMWILFVNNENSNSTESRHLIFDQNGSLIRSIMFWPSVSDFVVLFFHEEFTVKFASDKLFFNFWLFILSYFQGMHTHIKQYGHSLAYDSQALIDPFSCEAETCCSVCWSLFEHLKKPEHLDIVFNIIEWTRSHLSKWAHAVDFFIDDPSHDNKISFHIPLHRYLSCFLYLAIKKLNISPFTFEFTEKELLNMLAFPLRIQAGFYEIICGIWVHNGSFLRNQAFGYIDSKLTFCTCDTDLFLIKYVACVMDHKQFLDIFLRKFFVSQWLSCTTHRVYSCFIDQSQMIFMLEGCLTLLAQIMTLRFNLDSSDYELLRQEVVTILSVYDLPYSLIEKLLPHPYCPTLAVPDIENILKEVAVFSAPISNRDYGIQEGKYKPNDIIWETSYDPLHVILRSFKRKELQESIDRFKYYASTKLGIEKVGSLWLSLKLPPHHNDVLIKVRLVLQCRSLHKVLFMILYNYLKNNITSDRILQLVVYLLELAVDMFTCENVASAEEKIETPSIVSHVCNHGMKGQELKRDSSELSSSDYNNDTNDIFDCASAKRYHLDKESIPPASSETSCCQSSTCVCGDSVGHSASESSIKREVHLRNVYRHLSKPDTKEPCSCSSYSCICEVISDKVDSTSSSRCVCLLSDSKEQCSCICAKEDVSSKNAPLESQNQQACAYCKYIVCQCNSETANYQLKRSIDFKSSVRNGKHSNSSLGSEQSLNLYSAHENSTILSEASDFYYHDNILINFHHVVPTLSYEENELITDNPEDCVIEQLTFLTMNPYMLYTNTVAVQTENIVTNVFYREECKYRTKSAVKRIVREVAVQTYDKVVSKEKIINESMLTLLMKILMKSTASVDLASVLSQTKSLPERRVGDDAYFISLLLNKFRFYCHGCDSAVAAFCKEQKEDISEIRSKSGNEIFRKQKAQMRRAKIINQFASCRQDFLKKFGLSAECEDNTVASKNTDINCCICRSYCSTNSRQLIGLIGRMQLTNLPGLQRCIPFRLFSSTSEKFAELNSDVYKTLKDENEEDVFDFAWSASRFHNLITADLKCLQKKYEIYCSSLLWNRSLSFQSCEHYIHLDCYQSYMHSLQLNRVSNFELEISDLAFEENEFRCPVCRRKSNFVLPLLNYTESFWSNVKLDSRESLKHEIMMAINSDITCQSTSGTLSPPIITNFLDTVFMFLPMQCNSYTRCDISPAYFASLIRMQLECEFIANTSCYNFHSRAFILNLFRLLYFSAKMYAYDYEEKMWRNLSGIEERDANSTSYPPLILHDPALLIVRLLLQIPLPLPEAAFTYIIHIVFNFVVIQKIIGIILQTDLHETNQWQQLNSSTGSDFLKVVDTVLCSLKRHGLLPFPGQSSSASVNVLTYEGLCESVICACFHFLRLMCILKLYLYSEKQFFTLPEDISTSAFWRLCEFLCISSSAGKMSSLFNWHGSNEVDLIELWIKELDTASSKNPVKLYSCLTTCEFMRKPKFISLPERYCDLLKLMRFSCPYCSHMFEDVSLCLICGRAYPSRNTNCCNCMKQKYRKHCKHCGGGTQVVIFVNSTLIAVCTKRHMGIWGSVYLDEHGEEDREFKRGKPLFLNKERYEFLQEQWRSLSFDNVISRWISTFAIIDSRE